MDGASVVIGFLTNRRAGPWFRKAGRKRDRAATAFHSVDLATALSRLGPCVAPSGLRMIRFRIGADTHRPEHRSGWTGWGQDAKPNAAISMGALGCRGTARFARGSGARTSCRWGGSSGSCPRLAVETRPRHPRRLLRFRNEPERPLTVRPFRKKRSSARSALAHATVPGKTGPVSIYEDRDAENRRCRHDQGWHEGLLGRTLLPGSSHTETVISLRFPPRSRWTPGLKKTLIELNKLPPHG